MTHHKPPESLFKEKKAIPTMATARIQHWALTLANKIATLLDNRDFVPGGSDFTERKKSWLR